MRSLWILEGDNGHRLSYRSHSLVGSNLISLSTSHHDVQPLDRPKAMGLSEHRAMMRKPLVKICLPKLKSMLHIMLSQSESWLAYCQVEWFEWESGHREGQGAAELLYSQQRATSSNHYFLYFQVLFSL